MRPGSFPSSTRTMPSVPCGPVERSMVLSFSFANIVASSDFMPGVPKPPPDIAPNPGVCGACCQEGVPAFGLLAEAGGAETCCWKAGCCPQLFCAAGAACAACPQGSLVAGGG